MSHATTATRLVSLEIRGFRAFGTEPRTLDLDAGLVVIHAGNSQGKTSLAEAIEFLISGRSSRRELLGGAKAEYNDSLRNAHLADSDTDVYVQAVVRDAAGNTHQAIRYAGNWSATSARAPNAKAACSSTAPRPPTSTSR